MDNDTKKQSNNRRKTWITFGACAVIVAVAAILIFVIKSTEPSAGKSGATRKSAALVETLSIARGDYRPMIRVLGTVEPAKEIELSPRVGGQVASVASNFIPGGFVDAGEVLLAIDPSDYENALAIRRSELQQALASLEQELGQQEAARQEFALLGEEVDAANRSLVLREPQINSAKARVESARALVNVAELNLSRTQIRAPFGAQILSRDVNLGSQVSPGEKLAHLVGIEAYWIVASVPQGDLQWIELPDNAKGSRATITKSGVWTEGTGRTGHVERLIGTLDRQTRLARILITVKDPLGRETGEPPLLLGTVVECTIEGRQLNSVFRIMRDHLHANDTVWVFQDEKLNIRTVDVFFRDETYAYIRDGLEAGENVVTSNLATVVEGIPLRRVTKTEISGKKR